MSSVLYKCGSLIYLAATGVLCLDVIILHRYTLSTYMNMITSCPYVYHIVIYRFFNYGKPSQVPVLPYVACSLLYESHTELYVTLFCSKFTSSFICFTSSGAFATTCSYLSYWLQSFFFFLVSFLCYCYTTVGICSFVYSC